MILRHSGMVGRNQLHLKKLVPKTIHVRGWADSHAGGDCDSDHGPEAVAGTGSSRQAF